jgi:predicted aminopeptidase
MFLKGLKSLIAFVTDPQLRHEYALTERRRLQHEQDLLIQAARLERVRVAVAQDEEMYGSAAQMQHHLMQQRANFHAEMMAWKKLHGGRRGRK